MVRTILYQAMNGKWYEKEIADLIDPCLKGCVVLSNQHAHSLSELVKWFKVVIQKRAESNAPLTLEYCDELLDTLKTERSPNECSRSKIEG